MDSDFREAFEALRDAAQHLMAASQEIQQVGSALVRASESALKAKNEHEDLRETVGRLETLVMELVRRQRQQDEGRP